MNGWVAQIAALVCHGNASLRGMATPRFFAENSTCKFCELVEFVEVREKFFGSWTKNVIEDTPDDWFRRLKAGGTEGLRLGYAVGGGGTWHMTTLGRRPSRWTALWEVGDRQATDRRIWRVTYAGVGAGSIEQPRGPAGIKPEDERERAS